MPSDHSVSWRWYLALSSWVPSIPFPSASYTSKQPIKIHVPVVKRLCHIVIGQSMHLARIALSIHPNTQDSRTHPLQWSPTFRAPNGRHYRAPNGRHRLIVRPPSSFGAVRQRGKRPGDLSRGRGARMAVATARRPLRDLREHRADRPKPPNGTFSALPL
jgi:hypothetical protein